MQGLTANQAEQKSILTVLCVAKIQMPALHTVNLGNVARARSSTSISLSRAPVQLIQNQPDQQLLPGPVYSLRQSTSAIQQSLGVVTLARGCIQLTTECPLVIDMDDCPASLLYIRCHKVLCIPFHSLGCFQPLVLLIGNKRHTLDCPKSTFAINVVVVPI